MDLLFQLIDQIGEERLIDIPRYAATYIAYMSMHH